MPDVRMQRFVISLEQGLESVWYAFEDMIHGEIYVKKIPSIKVTELTTVIAPQSYQDIVGIRPDEKLHD